MRKTRFNACLCITVGHTCLGRADRAIIDMGGALGHSALYFISNRKYFQTEKEGKMHRNVHTCKHTHLIVWCARTQTNANTTLHGWFLHPSTVEHYTLDLELSWCTIHTFISHWICMHNRVCVTLLTCNRNAYMPTKHWLYALPAPFEFSSLLTVAIPSLKESFCWDLVPECEKRWRFEKNNWP